MQSPLQLAVCLAFLCPSVLFAAPGDADNDGLRDEVETGTGIFVSPDNTGTNPNVADSDGDSMPDGMEVSQGTNPTDAASRIKRPNIIYILADDMGYGDVGCFWQNQRPATLRFATPGLDAMATQGAMFTHHYASAPVCAGSRCSFLQGRHGGHADIREMQFDSPIPVRYSLPALLKSAGYRTIHVGKAGLAGPLYNAPTAHPLDRGFDQFFGYLTHGQAHEHYPRNGLGLNNSIISNGREMVLDAYQDLYSADAFTAYAKKSIIDCARDEPERPFFLYLSLDTPHFWAFYPPTPGYPAGYGVNGGLQWTGPPSYVNTATNDPAKIDNEANRHPSVNPNTYYPNARKWLSMVRRLDDSVTDILQTLRDLGIADNTLVVFSTDNGPANIPVDPQTFESYGPFEGMKLELLEGGIRVPTIAWWPGTLAATNQPSNIRKIGTPSASYDWLATFADLARCPIPAFADGTSLAPTLTGQGNQMSRGFHYFEMAAYGNTADYPVFIYHRNKPRGYMQAMRMGDFMGLRMNMTSLDDPFMIFDVVNDPKQSTNLAASQPGLQEQMKRLALGARRPSPTLGRPYDGAQIPSFNPTTPVKPGLKWKSYEGYWPWLPDFRTLGPVASGESPIPTTVVRPRNTDCGLSFEGYISIQTAGAYTFQISSNSGASLWIHEAHVLDNDTEYAPVKNSSTVQLKSGLHPIRLFYRHQTGTPQLVLRYSGPGITMAPIPETAFFQDGRPTALTADMAQVRSGSSVAVDVLANDSAEKPLQLRAASPPRRGTATIQDGKVVYMPSPGFIGRDSFSYSVFDGVREVSAQVQVQILFDDEMWIPLDELEGTDVAVYGGSGLLTGSLSGSTMPATAWVPGKMGMALQFDGVDDQVLFPNLGLPGGSAPRTVSCWLRTTNTSLDEGQSLFSYGQGSGNERFTVRLDRKPGTSASLVAAVEALPARIVGSKPLNDGAWHHVAVILTDANQDGSTDLSEMRILIDGQADNPSLAVSGVPATAGGTNALLGGRDDLATGNFQGTLDDVRLFSKALSLEEIALLYQATLANVIVDSDGDGMTDDEELVAGTNPNDSASFLRVDSITMQDGSVTLRWSAVAGRTYIVEESNEMQEWKPVPWLVPLVVGSSMPNASVSLPANGNPTRFFRLKASPTPAPGPDTDGDGYPDAAEAMAGTDPNDSSSFFRIDATTLSESGLSLQWHGMAGRRYRVEESTNLFQWMLVPDLPALDVQSTRPDAFIVVPSNGAAKRFLRLKVEQMPQ